MNAVQKLAEFDSYQLRLMRGVYAETGIKPPGFCAKGKGSVEKYDGLFRLQQFGYGPRGIDGTAGIAGSQNAAGDVMFSEYVYNDVSGSLTLGLPLYADVTDAAEFNVLYSGTATTGGKRTGGNVLLSTSANVGSNPNCVGIFAPTSGYNSLPVKGDTVRCLWLGRGLTSVATKAGGTAVLVGDVLIVDTTQTSLLSAHNTAVTNKTVAQALATLAAVTNGASILTVGGSTVAQVINAFVKMS
jgi:hypothetical protein